MQVVYVRLSNMYTLLVIVYVLNAKHWVMAMEYANMKECQHAREQLLHSKRAISIVCRLEKKKPHFSWHPIK